MPGRAASATIESPSTTTTGALPPPSTATGPSAPPGVPSQTALQSVENTRSAVLAAALLNERSPSAGTR